MEGFQVKVDVQEEGAPAERPRHWGTKKRGPLLGLQSSALGPPSEAAK